jgi:flagellin-like hook-associated protein FlgL
MSISGFPAFDRTADLAAAVRSRFAEQTAQTADGQRATTYAGLGSDARRAIELRSELGRREALARATSTGESRAAYAQTVLNRLTAIASQMANSAETVVGLDSSNASVAAQSARSALQEVSGLLNERFEGEAVFGGSDPENAPVPGDITQSGLYREIGRMLGEDLGAGTGPALRERVRALGQSNDPALTPFSQHAAAAARGEVADPRRAVPVEEGSVVAIGLYANRNAAAAPSKDKDSTGSWARDIITGLSVIAQLDSAKTQNGPDFKEALHGAIGMLRAGLKSVAEESGALGSAEERLSVAKRRHQEVSSQVEVQLAGVEEVDMAAALARLQSTQAQLEASYRSLSMLADLSLSRFLS